MSATPEARSRASRLFQVRRAAAQDGASLSRAAWAEQLNAAMESASFTAADVRTWELTGDLGEHWRAIALAMSRITGLDPSWIIFGRSATPPAWVRSRTQRALLEVAWLTTGCSPPEPDVVNALETGSLAPHEHSTEPSPDSRRDDRAGLLALVAGATTAG